MHPIRCPECGLVNHYEDVTFPHCGQCHEDLACCVYCRHFQGSDCAHPRAAALVNTNSKVEKICPEFHSRHEIHGSRFMARIAAPLWVSLLLVVIFAGIALAAFFIDPGNRYLYGNPLHIDTAIPKHVVAGQSFVVTMRISNTINRPSSHIYINVDKSFLAVVDWLMPLPKPLRIDRSRNRFIIEYEPIAARSDHVIQLPFIARHAGYVPFMAEIYAPSNQWRQTITAPIIVEQQTAIAAGREDE